MLNAVELHYFQEGPDFNAVAAFNGAATLLDVVGDGVMQNCKGGSVSLYQRGEFFRTSSCQNKYSCREVSRPFSLVFQQA